MQCNRRPSGLARNITTAYTTKAQPSRKAKLSGPPAKADSLSIRMIEAPHNVCLPHPSSSAISPGRLPGRELALTRPTAIGRTELTEDSARSDRIFSGLRVPIESRPRQTPCSQALQRRPRISSLLPFLLSRPPRSISERTPALRRFALRPSVSVFANFFREWKEVEVREDQNEQPPNNRNAPERRHGEQRRR